MSLPYNAVKRFYSTDVGAPTLSGTAGALVALLDAILVNGYGSVTVSGITRSGSIVTVVTSTAHGHDVGTVIKIAGADQTDYNGEWIVASAADSTHLTFDIGVLTPVTPATGSMTLKRAPVNWTKAFSGTNTAAYQLPAGTSEALLRIDDTVATYANVTGYESMTDVDTGTNSYASGTSVWAKSSTANSTGRSWIAYADDRYLWLLVRWHATNGRYTLYAFGDPSPTYSLDVYATNLIADTVSGGSSPGNNTNAMRFSMPNYTYGQQWYTTIAGHFCARAYSQVGASVAFGKITFAAVVMSNNTSNQVIGAYGMSYPAPHDGGLYVAPVLMQQGSVIRATIPGLYAPLHTLAIDATQFDGIANLPGRTLEACAGNTTGTSFQTALFDITGPWR